MFGLCYKVIYKELDFKAYLWKLRIRDYLACYTKSEKKKMTHKFFGLSLPCWQNKFVVSQFLKEQMDVSVTACPVLILLGLIRRPWTYLEPQGQKSRQKPIRQGIKFFVLLLWK